MTVYTGTSGNDTLVGGAGNDNLTGGTGNDILNGGAGNDWLEGNEGSDTLNGGAGWDVADYRSDNSIGATTGITASLVTNTVIDTTGSTDTLVSIEGIKGTEFADSITGANLNDELQGEGGNDTLVGGAGDDWLQGGTGDDILNGGAGDDSLDGGAGNDVLDGGAGWDHVDFRDSTSGVNVNFATGIAQDGLGGTDTLVNIERAVGSSFDDVLIGSAAKKESFTGGAGNDVIDGGAGMDFVFYGGAPAAITVDLATGVVTGGEGNDTLSNIEGLIGSNFSDTLYGDSGDNWFALDQSGDVYTPNYLVGGNDYVDGRGGFDGVGYWRAMAGVVVDLANETATDGFGNTDTLISIEWIIGSSFDDTLTGSAADNRFDGGDGNDTMDGGAGTDTAVFQFNFADAAISITNGVVTVASGGFTDTLTNFETYQFADGVRDVSDLVAGNQTIAGTAGADNVTGGSGADTLNGGAGNDSMSGGAGDDTIDGGDGNDVIVDGLGNNQITGGAGSDSIMVLSGNNAVSGGLGSDYLAGGFQADTLDGGAGNDVIMGDAAGGFLSGSDRITGGTGNDIMMGGGGADTFVFTTNDGADIISAFNAADVVHDPLTGYSATPTGADFTSGIDHIELVGFAGIDASNVMTSITSGADGAVFSASGTSITFFGVDVADLSANDFIFV